MGAGRGGMSRTITQGLIEKDLLDQYVATNISELENEYNQKMGKQFGDKFQVRKISFDNLFGEGNFTDADYGTFDVVCTCEALLHSEDKGSMALDVSKLLSKDGIFYISDILKNENSTPEEVQKVQDRFGSKMYINNGTRTEYASVLENAGLTKVWTHFEVDQPCRHYGLMRYLATGERKDKLLSSEGVTKEHYDKSVAGLDVWIKLFA